MNPAAKYKRLLEWWEDKICGGNKLSFLWWFILPIITVIVLVLFAAYIFSKTAQPWEAPGAKRPTASELYKSNLAERTESIRKHYEEKQERDQAIADEERNNAKKAADKAKTDHEIIDSAVDGDAVDDILYGKRSRSPGPPD